MASTTGMVLQPSQEGTQSHRMEFNFFFDSSRCLFCMFTERTPSFQSVQVNHVRTPSNTMICEGPREELTTRWRDEVKVWLNRWHTTGGGIATGGAETKRKNNKNITKIYTMSPERTMCHCHCLAVHFSSGKIPSWRLLPPLSFPSRALTWASVSENEMGQHQIR